MEKAICEHKRNERWALCLCSTLMYAGSTHVNFTQGQAFIEHHVWKLSETLSSSTAAQQVVGAAVHVVGNRSAGGRLSCHRRQCVLM